MRVAVLQPKQTRQYLAEAAGAIFQDEILKKEKS